MNKNPDIVDKLLWYNTLDSVLLDLLRDAAREILDLRTALRPFANWSNQISCKDIDNAKRLVQDKKLSLLEELVKQARGES
jgi:hypothetical protein